MTNSVQKKLQKNHNKYKKQKQKPKNLLILSDQNENKAGG